MNQPIILWATGADLRLKVDTRTFITASSIKVYGGTPGDRCGASPSCTSTPTVGKMRDVALPR